VDIPVQIFLILLAAAFFIGGISGLSFGKYWTDYLAGVFCLFAAALIAYGLHIQCDTMAIFHRCG